MQLLPTWRALSIWLVLLVDVQSGEHSVIRKEQVTDHDIEEEEDRSAPMKHFHENYDVDMNVDEAAMHYFRENHDLDTDVNEAAIRHFGENYDVDTNVDEASMRHFRENYDVDTNVDESAIRHFREDYDLDTKVDEAAMRHFRESHDLDVNGDEGPLLLFRDNHDVDTNFDATATKQFYENYDTGMTIEDAVNQQSGEYKDDQHASFKNTKTTGYKTYNDQGSGGTSHKKNKDQLRPQAKVVHVQANGMLCTDKPVLGYLMKEIDFTPFGHVDCGFFDANKNYCCSANKYHWFGYGTASELCCVCGGGNIVEKDELQKKKKPHGITVNANLVNKTNSTNEEVTPCSSEA
mmetsp:Transcript_10344/g.18421  ORF Transcript_10344/g.18421 Transcript_10344/m.18421 type:complete len:349 (+) Transcript_10344:93-1139(+)